MRRFNVVPQMNVEAVGMAGVSRMLEHTVRFEAFEHAIGLPQCYAAVAVNTLAKLMNDPQAPAATKITAAGMLLRFGRDGIELDGVAQRVESLEVAAEE